MLVSIEALLFVTIGYNYSRVKLLVIQRIIQSNHSIDYQDELQKTLIKIVRDQSSRYRDGSWGSVFLEAI